MPDQKHESIHPVLQHGDPTAGRVPPVSRATHEHVLTFLVKALDASRTSDEEAKNEARKMYADLDPRVSHSEPHRKAVDYVRHHLIPGKYVPEAAPKG